MSTKDNIIELLVFGYIRTVIESNQSWESTIPDPIKSLCTKFHGFVFSESKILNASQQLILWRLLSQKIEFRQTTLLYNALRDGFKEDAFYKNIEGKSPTIIIAHTNHGNIYGVFTTIKWKKKSRKSMDDKGFFWVLKSDKGDDIKPQIFAPKKRSIEVFQSGQSEGRTICFFECPAVFSFNIDCNINFEVGNVAYYNNKCGITDASVLCGGNTPATFKNGYRWGCIDAEIYQINQPYQFQQNDIDQDNSDEPINNEAGKFSDDDLLINLAASRPNLD